MRWRLFLDDERYPVELEDWRIARGFDDAVWYCTHYGLPYHISFDHDLGPNRYTGKDFANWFVNWVLDNEIALDGFGFTVHSQNPVGAKNIQALMIQLLDNERC